MLTPRQFSCGEKDSAGHGPHQLLRCHLRPVAVWRLTHPPSTPERAVPGKRSADAGRLTGPLRKRQAPAWRLLRGAASPASFGASVCLQVRVPD